MKTKITSGRMFELTFQTFGLHFNYIISLAAIFIAITFFLGFWAESFNETEPDMAGALLFMALLVAVYAKLAVMIHRLVILGEKGIGLVFSWSLKELKFIGWILMFVAAAYAVLFVLLQLLAKMLISSGTGMMTLVTLLIIIGLGALFSRVALVFPAAAADHRSSVKHAWELSANNKLSLFFLVVFHQNHQNFSGGFSGNLWFLVVFDSGGLLFFWWSYSRGVIFSGGFLSFFWWF